MIGEHCVLLMFIYLYFFLESEISEMLRALSSNLFVKVTIYWYFNALFWILKIPTGDPQGGALFTGRCSCTFIKSLQDGYVM